MTRKLIKIHLKLKLSYFTRISKIKALQNNLVIDIL